jgi:hypothetical protein
MAAPSHTPFIRRPKSHRTFDSTCTRCLLTIATDIRERELAKAEEEHVCNPWLMEQWKQLFEHDSAGEKTEKTFR